MQDSHLIPQPGVLKLSPSLSFILNLTKPTHDPYHPSDDTFVILTIQYLLQLCICLGANLKPTHLLGAPVYKRKRSHELVRVPKRMCMCGLPRAWIHLLLCQGMYMMGPDRLTAWMSDMCHFGTNG